MRGHDRSPYGRVSAEFHSFLDYAARRPLLSAQEEKSLSRAARRGCARSGTELVERNLLLVVSVARRHAGRGLPVEDLVQEGSVGLMQAARRFDPERNIRFSTYATWWIRQAIGRAVANSSRTIRLPVHVREKMSQLLTAKNELALELGRDAKPKEIALRLAWDPGDVSELLSHLPDAESLNRPVLAQDANHPVEVGDLVADPLAPDPAEEAALGLELARLEEEVARLTPREREALVMRRGLGERRGECATFREMGEAMGVSPTTAAKDAERALAILVGRMSGVGGVRQSRMEGGGTP